MNTITTDLAKFGARERRMVEELLKAWREQGLPEDFYNEKVTTMMNMQSGCVFLTNSEFQAAMMNDNKLESFYSCPQCGHEGFLEEMWHNLENDQCNEYCHEIGAEPDKDKWKNMSISKGTLIPKDLVCAIKAFNNGYIRNLELEALIEEYESFEEETLDDKTKSYLNEVNLNEIVQEIFDALNELSPEGYYFGAHPGNGSDFGFWEITEE